MKKAGFSPKRFVFTWWFKALSYALIVLQLYTQSHLSRSERVLLIVAVLGFLYSIFALGFQAFAKRRIRENETHRKPWI